LPMRLRQMSRNSWTKLKAQPQRKNKSNSIIDGRSKIFPSLSPFILSFSV
jgi:hypothetical protein